MDKQFNTLVRSLHDNYVEYKVTNKPSYQSSYESAQQSIEGIIADLSDEVAKNKAEIADFYKSGVEGKLKEMQAQNKTLQRGIVNEHDLTETAKLQAQPSSVSPDLTSQYITLGVLGAFMLGLLLL
jgi:hypothetical protein